MCIAENLDCVSSIKIDNFDCLQQCSGILVPSYDEEDIEEGIKNEMVKLVKYLIRKDDWWLYHDMQVEFKGLLNSKYEVEDKINKLTSDYWNYKTAKFVDQLSAIGGTMGLLTGFSIISGVEIVYFAVKITFGYFNSLKEKTFE